MNSIEIKDQINQEVKLGTEIKIFQNKTDAMIYALKFAQYGREEYKRLIGQILNKGILKHDNELIIVDELKILG